jgi:hypothetical protein
MLEFLWKNTIDFKVSGYQMAIDRPVETFIQIAAGESHTCALRSVWLDRYEKQSLREAIRGLSLCGKE